MKAKDFSNVAVISES